MVKPSKPLRLAMGFELVGVSGLFGLGWPLKLLDVLNVRLVIGVVGLLEPPELDLCSL